MLVFQARKASLTCLAFSSDSRTLAASGYGGCVQLWDLDSHQLRRTLVTGWWKHERLFFSSDGRELFVLSCYDIHRFNLSEGERVSKDPQQQTQGALAAAVSPDGRSMCLGVFGVPGRRPALAQFTLPDFDPVWRQSEVGPEQVSALAYSGDSRLLASGFSQGRVTVCDTRTGATWWEPTGNETTVRSIALSPDGKFVAWSAATQLHLWRLDPLEQILRHSLGRTFFLSVAFHPSGDFFATANGDGKIDYWDGRTGEHRQAFDWQVGKLSDVIFDPTGDCAACCSDTGAIVIWDVDR
jgi:WD40 repeat protein